MSALSLPEVKHMLDVLLGSLTALEDLMKTARSEKEPSIIKLAVNEAETASKTCVRLSQAVSAYQASHPEEGRKRNAPPPSDPEFAELVEEFLRPIRQAFGSSEKKDGKV